MSWMACSMTFKDNVSMIYSSHEGVSGFCKMLCNSELAMRSKPKNGSVPGYWCCRRICWIDWLLD